MNVPTDLFGGGGRQAVCDNLSLQPSALGQEMGHGYGLQHSRMDGSIEEYKDRWDTMSTYGDVYMASDSEFSLVGPILNAWNMRGRGWLDESRVWAGSDSGYNTTIYLRPLVRHELPGLLAADLPGGYLVEFRVRKGWDAGIPRPAILIHRFEDNISYIMANAAGQQDLVEGDTFEIGSPGDTDRHVRVEVQNIDTETEVATLRLQYRPLILRRRFELVAEIFGGIAVDGDGIVVLPGRGGVRRIPPRSPALRMLKQIATLSLTSELETQPSLRDEIRREALNVIIHEAEAALKELEVFHTPPPRVKPTRGKKASSATDSATTE